MATGQKVRSGLALTGEITLRGRVLPIGGLKEKVLAAYRAGIREIVLPEWNAKELVKLPDDVRENIKFHPVKTMDEVIEIVFNKKI